MAALGGDIEALILSGEFFNPQRSTSPVRTPSPDSGWHDDEEEDDDGRDSDIERSKALDRALGSEQQDESIGMGVTGRTGVKGVIRDRDEANANIAQKRSKEVKEMNKRMEKASLGGKTFLEEEREKESLEEMTFADLDGDDKTDVFGRQRRGRFGHLREVGVKGFVGAVEQEAKGVWVVVHLHEPTLDRCFVLDDTLSRLARAYPDTKFLRARATALGFATKTPKKAAPASTSSIKQSTLGRYTDDDDDEDPYADNLTRGPSQHDEDDYDSDEDEVDTDVLPTMLVYRDGELMYNWVRVDWEAGRAGVEELLTKHRILSQGIFGNSGNCGFTSDDEDEFE